MKRFRVGSLSLGFGFGDPWWVFVEFRVWGSPGRPFVAVRLIFGGGLLGLFGVLTEATATVPVVVSRRSCLDATVSGL